MVVEFILLLKLVVISEALSLDNHFLIEWHRDAAGLHSADTLNYQFSCLAISSWCGISTIRDNLFEETIVLSSENGTPTVTLYYNNGFTTELIELLIFQSEINVTGIFASFIKPEAKENFKDLVLRFGYSQTQPYQGFFQVGSGIFSHDLNGIKFIPADHLIQSVSLDSKVLLQWEFFESSIMFTVTCFNIQSWCGFTFGIAPDSSETIIIAAKGSSVSVNSYSSQGFNQPSFELTGTLTLHSASLASSGLMAKFSRERMISNSQLKEIQPGMTTEFSYAYQMTQSPDLKYDKISSGLLSFGSLTTEAKFLEINKLDHYTELDSNIHLGWKLNNNSIVFTINCFNIHNWCKLILYQDSDASEEIIATASSSGTTIAHSFKASDWHSPSPIPDSLFPLSLTHNSTGIFISISRPIIQLHPLCTLLSTTTPTIFSYSYSLLPCNHYQDSKGSILLTLNSPVLRLKAPVTELPYFSLDKNFYLGWEFTSTDIIFTFNCFNISTWCAIDFVHGMSNTEMIVLQNTGGPIAFNDYYSRSQSIPTSKVMDLTLIRAKVNSSGLFGNMSRPLNTKSVSNAKDITLGLYSELGYAYLTSGGSFYKHNKQSGGYITLGATMATSNYSTGGVSDSSHADFLKNHGIYMTIMWVGIIQLAIVSIRYFKWSMFSGAIHVMFAMTAQIFTLVSAYETYKKQKNPYSDIQTEKDLRYHSRMAFTICALTMAQGILGIFFRYAQIFKSNIRLTSLARGLHQSVGWSLPIISMINIKYGWKLKGDSYKLDDYIYPAYGVMCALIFLLEIRHRWGYLISQYCKRKRNYHLDNMSIDGKKSGLLLTDSLDKRHIDVIEEIKRNNRDWVFYDEFILDVSGFKWNHPGGSFMFPIVRGQDIGKYINGCSSVDSTFPYYHSTKARGILESLKIGRVSYPLGVLTNLSLSEKQENMTWKLAARNKIANNTYCFEFSSDSWHANQDLSGYEWMGKHFLFTCKIKGQVVNRYYSHMAVNLAEWAHELTAQGYPSKAYNIERDPKRLRFHIKHYPGGRMTSHLCTMRIGDTVTLKGPLSPGMSVTEIHNKNYLIFAAGTGILPFLDIVHYIWTGKLTGCCLYFYISFRDENSSFALDLLEATAKKHPNTFKLFARLGEAGFQLQGEFWRNVLPLHISERAWVCGPPVFMLKIKEILIGEGVENSKITLL